MTQKQKGILCITASSFFFALMNLFVRLSGDLPSMQKSFFRNFVALGTPQSNFYPQSQTASVLAGIGRHRGCSVQLLCRRPSGSGRRIHAQ